MSNVNCTLSWNSALDLAARLVSPEGHEGERECKEVARLILSHKLTCPECDIEDGACAKCGNYCLGCGVSLDLECKCCKRCKKDKNEAIKP